VTFGSGSTGAVVWIKGLLLVIGVNIKAETGSGATKPVNADMMQGCLADHPGERYLE
jgi:hypothetical protein